MARDCSVLMMSSCVMGIISLCGGGWRGGEGREREGKTVKGEECEQLG